MTDEPAAGMHHAGPRLREIRQALGLSLTAVASSAGVTKGFLSLAERSKTSVSVPTLLAICRALDISIGSLFDYPDDSVVRREAPVDMGGLNLAEYLLTPASEASFQVMRTVIEPGGGSGGGYALDADTVFATVVRGTLLLVVAGEARLLDAGASTTYPGRTEHSYSNPGARQTEVIWVIAPPLPRS